MVVVVVGEVMSLAWVGVDLCCDGLLTFNRGGALSSESGRALAPDSSYPPAGWVTVHLAALEYDCCVYPPKQRADSFSGFS